MTNLCVLLTFACFLTAIVRARWVALAMAPPCLLILARLAGLVDLSSASHPLRWIVPVASMGLAGQAAWKYAIRIRAVLAKRDWIRALPHEWQGAIRPPPEVAHTRYHAPLFASILVFASAFPDLLALHPFFWARFETWSLVPVQIVACVSILVALLAPERWIQWLKT
jgi:hypothetical protein